MSITQKESSFHAIKVCVALEGDLRKEKISFDISFLIQKMADLYDEDIVEPVDFSRVDVQRLRSIGEVQTDVIKIITIARQAYHGKISPAEAYERIVHIIKRGSCYNNDPDTSVDSDCCCPGTVKVINTESPQFYSIFPKRQWQITIYYQEFISSGQGEINAVQVDIHMKANGRGGLGTFQKGCQCGVPNPGVFEILIPYNTNPVSFNETTADQGYVTIDNTVKIPLHLMVRLVPPQDPADPSATLILARNFRDTLPQTTISLPSPGPTALSRDQLMKVTFIAPATATGITNATLWIFRTNKRTAQYCPIGASPVLDPLIGPKFYYILANVPGYLKPGLYTLALGDTVGPNISSGPFVGFSTTINVVA